MRNAILRNYLKLYLEYNVYACFVHCFYSLHFFFKLHKPRNSGIPLVYGEIDLLLGGHIHVVIYVLVMGTHLGEYHKKR